MGQLKVEGRALRGQVCHIVSGFAELSPPEFPGLLTHYLTC